MVPDYIRAIAIFPTFFFLVMFLILSAVYYNRYRNDDSDERAFGYFRDYIVIMNSQSSLISVINGLIIVVLFSNIAVGVVMALITQALVTYVFVAHYMKSNYDALFFLAFSVLGYVFELLFMLFAGHTTSLFGREVWGLEMALLAFITVVAAITIVIILVAAYANRSSSEEKGLGGEY